MLNNNYMGYNNPYQPQIQRLNYLEQQQTQQAAMPRVMEVQTEDMAKNTQIPFDGSKTYFVYGDTIMARKWNVSEGKIDTVTFKIENSINTPPEKENPLKDVLDRLERIENKLTYPINKKAVKDAE